jgi:RNA polymerase sigma-70 factor (ECF subfamily)
MLFMSTAEPHRFATTHWSLVRAAQGAAPEARAALGALCQTYWYPLYAYIRRQGHPPDRAQDLTQELFARLLEKDALASVDEGRGRFRSFLLAACRHFLSNQRDWERALKRGGGLPPIPIGPDAEGRYAREPAHEETAERLFERRWALALLERAIGRLRTEHVASSKERLFECLKGHLTGDGPPHTQTAEALGMSEGAVKVAVHRLRGRYRELLHDEIAQTLSDPADFENEVRALFAALGP